jgi:hypothetical protein
VPDVNPTSAEQACAFLLEALRICVRSMIHAELSRCLIVNYVRGVCLLHSESPRDMQSATQQVSVKAEFTVT